MATFIISNKLTIDEALKAMVDLEAWFRKNPTRKVCQTDTFRVRRGYVVEDVLLHTNWKYIDL